MGGDIAPRVAAAPSARAARTEETAALPARTLAALAAAAEAGREARAMLGRRIALAAWPGVFAHVDYEDDAPFRDPALFLLGADPSRAAALPRALTAPRDGPPMRYLEAGLPGAAALIGPHRPAAPADMARRAVEGAAALVRLRLPGLWALLSGSVERIAGFAGSATNSCAAELAPGTVLLNMGAGVSAVSLVEDLVHQAVHCVFSDVELSGAPVYRLPADRPISDWMTGPSDGRSLSVLHHSSLTESFSLIALGALAPEDLPTRLSRIEAGGRIAFLKRKLAVDRRYVEGIGALAGDWPGHFAALFDRAEAVPGDGDTARQPYAFDLGLYLEENGLGRAEDAAPALAAY